MVDPCLIYQSAGARRTCGLAPRGERGGTDTAVHGQRIKGTHGGFADEPDKSRVWEGREQ